MVTLKDLMEFLESLAPSSLAEEYDNVGLLVGDAESSVSKVLISLDTDEKVVDEARRIGADMILSHHPLLFHPLKQILMQDHIGKTMMGLIRENINLYAMHTNFDSAENGLCDYFVKYLFDTKPCTSICGEFPTGIGRMVKLPEKINFKTLLERIKNRFNLTQIRFVGSADRPIQTIAVCNGGGADLIYDAHRLGADVYLSGDLKYHHARYAYENDFALVEVPHYEAEILFCNFVAEQLQVKFGHQCEFVVYENENPWKSL